MLDTNNYFSFNDLDEFKVRHPASDYQILSPILWQPSYESEFDFFGDDISAGLILVFHQAWNRKIVDYGKCILCRVDGIETIDNEKHCLMTVYKTEEKRLTYDSVKPETITRDPKVSEIDYDDIPF